MNIENLPSLNPPDFGNVVDSRRPILSFSWATSKPHQAAAHSHSRGHILYVEEGSYWVTTPDGTWLVPTNHAIWIPPRIYHEVFSRRRVEAKILFVNEAQAKKLNRNSGTVRVSPLLSELIRQTVKSGNNYKPNSPQSRLAFVVLDELTKMKIEMLMLPISRESRLERAMMALQTNLNQSIASVAKNSGASIRTLERLFIKETGMTFSQWRTRLLLTESIERLSKGEAVTSIAVDYGYSPSGFAQMFKSNLGYSPSQYCQR